MMRRWFILAIVAAAVAAAVVLCVSRWDVWFYNVPEAPYTPSEQPGRVLLTFGDSGGLSRNVSWMCGTEVRESSLELEVEDAGGSVVSRLVEAVGEVYESRGGRAAYYVSRLCNLSPGRHYRYRVCTGGCFSPWYEFFTQAAEESDVAFVYVGDVQDTVHGISNRLLREAFRRNPDASSLVCGGDLVERPIDAYWDEVFAGLDSVGQSVPVLTITGNHDYLKGVVCRLERRFSLIHSYFLGSMVGDNQVFTVRQGDVQFFLLDSNRELPHLAAQRRWLEEQLRASTAKWRILLLHHPLYSVKGSMNNLLQRWMFDSLVRDYDVDLVLQAHEHAYARMTDHDAQGEPTTPVYTVSHCSPKNYRIEFPDLFDKFGTGSRYYQTVRTHGDTMSVAAYDAIAGELYDSLQIVKGGGCSGRGRGAVLDYGFSIPERLVFSPRHGSRKDSAFAERIRLRQESHKP